jgi:ubiquinone biosynthesis monooxygenase Coq7
MCSRPLSRSAFFNNNKDIANKLTEAATEEIDHLAWCESRINELNGSKSKLNPFLYISSFGIGALASVVDEKYNLGFLSETESQVALHLESHIKKLNPSDKKTLKIIKSMKEEEEAHKRSAVEMGGVELPNAIKKIMGIASKIMTITTYKV